MENSRHGFICHRNNYRRYCRRFFQQWQACLIFLASCQSAHVDHLTTEEYRVSRVQTVLGDSLLGLTIEIVRLGEETKTYLLPNSGAFSTAKISLDNHPFPCHLLKGNERILLTEEAAHYLITHPSATIKTDHHQAEVKINFPEQLSLLLKKTLPFPDVILDLRS